MNGDSSLETEEIASSDHNNERGNRFRQFLKHLGRNKSLSRDLPMDIGPGNVSEISLIPPNPEVPSVILSPAELERINEEITRGKEEDYIFNVRPRYDVNVSPKYIERLRGGIAEVLGEEAAERAVAAPHIAKMGIFGLFDGVYQKFAGNDFSEVDASFQDAERGFVEIFRLHNDGVVIKDWQGDQERQIAQVASDKGLGPKIYGPGLQDVEDYLPEGGFENLSPTELGKLGGQFLRGLHDNDIIYADTFADHLRLDPKDGKVKVIDFGVSFMCDGVTPIDSRYLWRVIPMVSPGISKDEFWSIKREPEEAKKYATLPPEQIKAREFELMQDALNYIASNSMANGEREEDVVNQIAEGLKEGYYPTDEEPTSTT